MAWGSRRFQLRVPDGPDGPLSARERARRRRRAGFTVIEVVISVGVLSVMMSLAGLAMMRSASAYQDTTQRTMLEIRTRRALDRILDEMATVAGSTMIPALQANFDSDTVTFQQVVDIAGTVPVLGTQCTVAFQYAPGEADNGLDDDGNGLVDDGMLVLIRDVGAADQTNTVLCRGVPELLEGETADGADENGNGLVDESGFSLSRVGDTVVVRLTSQQPDGQGGVVSCTVETSVSVRN